MHVILPVGSTAQQTKSVLSCHFTFTPKIWVAILRLFCLVLLAATGIPASGQTQPNLENGFKAYGTYDGSSVDTVNGMNGNLMIHITAPFHAPQRGGKLDVQFGYYATSKNWIEQCVNTPDSTTPTCGWTSGVPAGCVLPYANINGDDTVMQCAFSSGLFTNSRSITVQRMVNKTTQVSQPTHYSGFSYVLVGSDLSSHQLTPVTAASTTEFNSVDNTGYHVEMSNPDSFGVTQTVLVTDRQGNQYLGTFPTAENCTGPAPSASSVPTSSQGNFGWQSLGVIRNSSSYSCGQLATFSSVTDANGNVYNYAGSDTMGKAAPSTATSDVSGCGGPMTATSAAIYNYPGPNGGTTQVKFCYANVALQTAFGISGVSEVQNLPSSIRPGPRTPFVTAIVLPDQSQWTFQYDSYGEITLIGLPLGGSISYGWATIAQPHCGDITPVSRAVVSRIITDNNGNSFHWTYSWGTAANGVLTNTVTDPLVNDTDHTFTSLDGAGGCSFYETGTVTYQGSGAHRQALKKVDTAYSSAGFSVSGGEGWALGNVFASDIKTTVHPNGKVSLVHRTPDPGLGSGQPMFGNVVQQLEYDWGQGSPGALLRETDTTYRWQNDGLYLSARLLDLPASVVIKSSAGTRLAETDSTYDEPAYLSPSEITAQHGAAPNPAPVRGNLTTVGKWLNTTNNSITSHTNWYDTGEVYKIIDPMGHTTTHSYDPTYVGTYSTSSCNALNQCVSGTYDFTTGLLTSFTNWNATQQASGNTPGDAAHTTTYSYDFLSRITSAVFPPDPANTNGQAQTTFTYPTLTERDVAKRITGALTDHASAFLDGLGRPIQTQHQTPSGIAKVDTTYDGLNHAAVVSNPYFSTTDSIYGNTQTQYDALGRVTGTTRQDNTVSSASYNIVTSISGTADCSISMDEAGKQRGSCTDALGRLVEVDEPTGNPVQAQNYATLQTDGNFVVYNHVGNALWSTGTAGTNSTSIFMQDDGNLVLYMFRWQAGTYAAPIAGSYPASTCSIGTYLKAGQTLPSGKCISSPHGQYFLLMNTDGNLFIYDWAHATGTWGPGTQGHPGAYAIFQTDGNFVVYAANGAFLWNSGTSGTYAERLNIEDDGRIIIYKASWESGTSNGQTGGTAIAHPSCDIGTGTGTTGVIDAGSCFVSPNGRFEMLMQNDGNLEIYDRSTTPASAIFAVNTNISPADPGVGMRTLYAYDALGNLTCVEQHGSASTGTGCSAPASSDAASPWRVRRFTYDSLSRLLTATNPESGQISYSYDADGNLLQKTSPAPNQTGVATQTISYCYDALHRLAAEGYGVLNCPIAPGSAVVSYVYDQGTNGIGHLSSLTDQAGSAIYSYDVLGRLTKELRSIAGVSKSIGYDYNLDGSLKTLTYPSGAAINYTPDSAGRVLSAVDSSNNLNYVTAATYNASNALTGFVSGQSNSFAGITNAFSFNKRLQPVNMSASAPSWAVFSIGYDFHLGSGNNGNVYGISNYKDANRNQTFTYDALNRLTSAQNAGTDCSLHLPDGHTEYWGNNYGYDAWGNLLQKTVTKCTAENMNISADGHNRIHTITGTDYAYDAAGNTTYNATSRQGYTYDQENRITGLSGNAYTYDADGNRVMKTTTAMPSTGTLYWYMTPGIVAESDLAGDIKSEYVFFGGERVARRDTNSGVFYYFSDHLKTATMETDASGNIKDESDFYPWGGELQFTNSNDNHYKFTGKERDQETQLDYFGVRYYGNAMGRWLSPDPKQLSKKHVMFPQRWNKYSYVQNDPIGSIDPDGLEDYKIFLATPEAGGNWSKAAAFAKANGHTLEVFKGKDASIANFNAALSNSNNRVVFVGHTSHDPATGNTTAAVLGDGRSNGVLSTTQQIGPVDAHGTANATETTNQPIVVNADTVAVFGCQSIDLASAFSGAGNFVGMDSGSDHLSLFGAMSAGAEAFVEADATARPAGAGGAVADATVDRSNQAFQQNTSVQKDDSGKVIATDSDGDKVTKASNP